MPAKYRRLSISLGKVCMHIDHLPNGIWKLSHILNVPIISTPKAGCQKCECYATRRLFDIHH